ncbi:MAG: NUDIX hydrolase, partial [Actinobacteria bacterium]
MAQRPDPRQARPVRHRSRRAGARRYRRPARQGGGRGPGSARRPPGRRRGRPDLARHRARRPRRPRPRGDRGTALRKGTRRGTRGPGEVPGRLGQSGAAQAHRLVAVTGLIRAAGGVPWRATDAGTEVALVHRPRYGDWTLPKGKLEHGEHPFAAAVREVFEETGITGTPQVRLPTIRYLTGEPGAEKQLEFWSMAVRADIGREPDHEIAEVRWVPVARAGPLLSYAHDRGVLAAFAALPRITAHVTVVRHGRAGTRSAWSGPDRLRPLDSVGRHQVEALTNLLALTGPDRIRSATALRCRETVAPLA